MSFTITLYKTTTDPRYLNPSYTTVATLTGTLRDNSTSITHPVVKIDNTGTAIDTEIFTTVNEAYISQFGRYYFVRDIEINYTGIVYLHLDVDVLWSFASWIKGCYVVADRSYSAYDLTIYDEEMPLQSSLSFGDMTNYTSYPVFTPNASPYVIFNVIVSTTVATESKFAYPNQYDSSTSYGLVGNASPYGKSTIQYAFICGKAQEDYLQNVLQTITSGESTYADSILSMTIMPANTILTNSLSSDEYGMACATKQLGYACSVITSTPRVMGMTLTWTLPYTNPSTTSFDYRNLNPITNYYMYLPLIGVVEIPSEIIFHGSNGVSSANLYLKWTIDFIENTLTYFLCDNSQTYRVFMSWSCGIGAAIPVTNDGSYKNTWERIANIWNTLTLSGASAVQQTATYSQTTTAMQAGSQTAATAGIAGGGVMAIQALNSIGNGVINHMLLQPRPYYTQNRGSNYAQELGFAQGYGYYVSTFYTTHQMSESYTSFISLNGGKCCKFGYVSEFTGYLRCADVRLVPTGTTTLGTYPLEEEQGEIIRKLKQGIYIY